MFLYTYRLKFLEWLLIMVLSVSTLKSAATQGTKFFSKPQTLKNVNLQELRYETSVILDALKTDSNISMI